MPAASDKISTDRNIWDCGIRYTAGYQKFYLMITDKMMTFQMNNFHFCYQKLNLLKIDKMITFGRRSFLFQCFLRADSRLVPSQRETSLQSNAVSHCLGANLESAVSNVMTSTFSEIPFIYWWLHAWLQYLHWDTTVLHWATNMPVPCQCWEMIENYLSFLKTYW